MREHDSRDDEFADARGAHPELAPEPSRPSLGPWPPAAEEHEPLAPGTVIADRFRVGRALGRGGHGTVYLAEHITLGYPVAVKVLHAGFGLDARRRARFRREALLGARLRHRNVVAIIEAGELEDGAPFLVMEHVDGIDLESLIERSRLDTAAAVEIGVQLLAGLTALVERGVIHRDIKPGNVMLQPCVDGFVEVKLLDFGISKALRGEAALETLTADDCVLGTPQYMPPEQVRGEPLDVRADLYSVGGVLFECVTGEPPFDAETAGSVMARILVERARPVRSLRPDVPEEVARVIDRALAHDAAERWRHPAEMSEALRSAAQRLGLPRGADAWSVLERDGGSASSPATLGRGTGATLSAPIEPDAPVVVSHAPGDSVPPRSAPSTSTRSPGVLPPRRARRPLLVGVAAVVALATAAATSGGDAGTSAPIRPASVGPETGASATTPASVAPPTAVHAAPLAHEAAPAPARAVNIDPDPYSETSASRHRAARGPRGAARPDVDPARLEALALDAFVAGREREAIGLYQRATELAPERPSAWRGFGLAAASAGERRPAINALRRYLELAPDARDRELVEQQIAQLSRPRRGP